MRLQREILKTLLTDVREESRCGTKSTVVTSLVDSIPEVDPTDTRSKDVTVSTLQMKARF